MADVISYITACNSVSAEWWGSALQRKRGKLRFRTYCGRKRCLDRFYHGLVTGAQQQPLAAGKQLVIAYGAATFSPSGKGHVATPTTAAYKACRRLRGQGVVVEPQNESRTSRQCCHCHGDVEPCWLQCQLRLTMAADSGSLSAAIQVQTCHGGGRVPDNGVRLRGLLFCPNCSKYLNRDRSAALCIRYLFVETQMLGRPMPTQFRPRRRRTARNNQAG